jgi:hypothetical protein
VAEATYLLRSAVLTCADGDPGVLARVDWFVRTNVSEQRAVTIVRVAQPGRSRQCKHAPRNCSHLYTKFHGVILQVPGIFNLAIVPQILLEGCSPTLYDKELPNFTASYCRCLESSTYLLSHKFCWRVVVLRFMIRNYQTSRRHIAGAWNLTTYLLSHKFCWRVVVLRFMIRNYQTSRRHIAGARDLQLSYCPTNSAGGL